MGSIISSTTTALVISSNFVCIPSKHFSVKFLYLIHSKEIFKVDKMPRTVVYKSPQHSIYVRKQRFYRLKIEHKEVLFNPQHFTIRSTEECKKRFSKIRDVKESIHTIIRPSNKTYALKVHNWMLSRPFGKDTCLCELKHS